MTSWRDVIKIHPAADLFPMMSEAELRELGEDIKRNGIVSPIIMWSAGAGVGGTTRQHGRYRLLDGRNRLAAAEMAGLKIDYDIEVGAVYVAEKEVSRRLFEYRTRAGAREKWIDPVVYALSANIHRRHLTGEQKRELIAKLLKAEPEKSDRRIAEIAKADYKTVGAVRAEQEGRGEIPRVEKRTDSTGREQPAGKSAKEPPTACEDPSERSKSSVRAPAPPGSLSGEPTSDRTNTGALIAELRQAAVEYLADWNENRENDQPECQMIDFAFELLDDNFAVRSIFPVLCRMLGLSADPWPGLTNDDLNRMLKGQKAREKKLKGFREKYGPHDFDYEVKLRALQERTWLTEKESKRRYASRSPGQRRSAGHGRAGPANCAPPEVSL